MLSLKAKITISLLLSSSSCLMAQDVKKDSLIWLELETVKVSGYFTPQTPLTTSSTVSVITSRTTDNGNSSNLLNLINTVPGIRMEERSPGSYRLALRGNMIRSPFGVRNVKIYMDDFPLTDAGGNTYINLLDPASINSMEVLKGPDGSLFGANSGGVLIITPNGFQNTDQSRTSLNLAGGSYGFAQQQLSTFQQVNEKYKFSFDQSFTRSDGYRENSALNKKTFQTAHQWDYSKKGHLKAFALYSDINYETPGGLTKAQYDENPAAARPATAVAPSASEQQAAIRNKTFYGGISNSIQITDKISNVTAVFGSSSRIENPFITNYEFRKESNLGYRSYFSYVSNNHLDLEIQLGTEGQKGWYDIDNYDNNRGVKADPQAHDKLENWQNFHFLRSKIKPIANWTVEASVGVNYNSINYKGIYPTADTEKEQIKFQTKWMPRIATSYLILPNLALRASISSGFSAPTIAEVRSSNNLINSDLKPESGTNYEAGVRWETLRNRLVFDMAYYQYKMNDAIIRQSDDNGVEFYQNAGKIQQNGFESSITGYILKNTNHFLNALIIRSSLTYNHYRFADYQVEDENYKNNKLTSVPDWVIVHNLDFHFKKQIVFHVQHNYTSSIPLNDANTTFAKEYHLLQAKVDKQFSLSDKLKANIYVGVDNLLNEKYSLGNDINAFGGRYYNAAPKRNIFTGLRLSY